MKSKLLCLMLLVSGHANAQENIHQYTDSIINQFLLKHAGAITVGINNNGKKYYFNYGETSKGNQHLPDSNSIFEIGNITETFTSILYADLSTKGLVGMDDPVQKYLPVDVPMPVYQQLICMPSDKVPENNISQNKQDISFLPKYTEYTCVPDPSSHPQPILLCYLSTHTSGLPDFPPNLNRKKNKQNPFAEYSKENLYDFLRTYSLVQPTGFDYKHSELGTALLGHAISLKMNKSYDSLLTERILDPMNMKDTRIHLTSEQNLRFLQGYNEKGNPVQHWTYDVLAPAGALRSTASDMMTFLSANISRDKNTLSPILDYTHNPRIKLSGKKQNPREIALGWKISPYGTEVKNIVWQSGRTGGFSSFIGFIETSHKGVVILSSNSEDISELGIKLVQALENETKNENQKPAEK